MSFAPFAIAPLTLPVMATEPGVTGRSRAWAERSVAVAEVSHKYASRHRPGRDDDELLMLGGRIAGVDNLVEIAAAVQRLASVGFESPFARTSASASFPPLALI
jgi:hypothetical protein